MRCGATQFTVYRNGPEITMRHALDCLCSSAGLAPHKGEQGEPRQASRNLRAAKTMRHNRGHFQGSNTPSAVFLGSGGIFPMPRYFFSPQTRSITILDQEGSELTDIAAEHEAARRAQEIVTANRLQGATASKGAIIVSHENWQTVLEAPF
jgi:hypothetical protein